MVNNILIVCVANICRSPVAEAILKTNLAKIAPHIVISSAGIAAFEGKPAAPLSVAYLKKKNIDISKHRSRQLTENMVKEASLILTMEASQQKTIEQQFPHARGKVYLIGKWNDFEVMDPYRGGVSEYEFALDLIEKGLVEWQKKILSE